MEYTHWWGPHSHGFWFMPLVFMTLMVFFAILIARRTGGWRCGCGNFGRDRFDRWRRGRYSLAHQGSEGPGQILDRRYASGEITKEQHEQMKRYIEREG